MFQWLSSYFFDWKNQFSFRTAELPFLQIHIFFVLLIWTRLKNAKFFKLKCSYFLIKKGLTTFEHTILEFKEIEGGQISPSVQPTTHPSTHPHHKGFGTIFQAITNSNWNFNFRSWYNKIILKRNQVDPSGVHSHFPLRDKGFPRKFLWWLPIQHWNFNFRSWYDNNNWKENQWDPWGVLSQFPLGNKGFSRFQKGGLP